jgi:photosystem II stability/assembly factor-like uncharacterized protein
MNLPARAVRRAVAITAVTGAVALTPALALAAPGAAASTGAVTAVPAGFEANSLTWLSPAQGRVLGAAPCGTGTCSDVIGTSDAGKTWSLLGTVKAPLATSAHSGITDLRFATPRVGWAFGPRLFLTTDGGRSWASQQIPGGGKQILSLAAGRAGAYAIVSPCAWGTGLCGHQPLSLWHTSAHPGGAWTSIPLDLPINVTASVSLYGKTVYVVDGSVRTLAKGKLYASTDGRHFAARTSPCAAAKDIFLAQAVPTSPTDVSFLCDGNPGFSKAVKSVYRSVNTGKTDTFAGTMGPHGIQAQLAVSRSGNLAVASWSDGSFMYVNDTHSKGWTMVIGSGDGGAGWNDITYVTNTEAWVVYGPADTPAHYGQLYVTRDAGQHWTLAKL